MHELLILGKKKKKESISLNNPKDIFYCNEVLLEDLFGHPRYVDVMYWMDGYDWQMGVNKENG